MFKNLHVAAMLIALAAVLGLAPSASAQIGKIVGLGAARCAQFTLDVERSPVMQQDYLAWAQGFLSGVLLSQPAGVDEGVDLIPQSLPLLQQLEFLRGPVTLQAAASRKRRWALSVRAYQPPRISQRA